MQKKEKGGQFGDRDGRKKNPGPRTHGRREGGKGDGLKLEEEEGRRLQCCRRGRRASLLSIHSSKEEEERKNGLILFGNRKTKGKRLLLKVRDTYPGPGIKKEDRAHN